MRRCNRRGMLVLGTVAGAVALSGTIAAAVEPVGQAASVIVSTDQSPAQALQQAAPPPPTDQDPTKAGIQLRVPYYNEPEFLLVNEQRRWNIRNRPAGTIAAGYGAEDGASHDALIATARYNDLGAASATYGTLPPGTSWKLDPLDVAYFDSDTDKNPGDGTTMMDRPYYVTHYQAGVIDIVGPVDTTPERHLLFAPPEAGITYVGGAVEYDTKSPDQFAALLVRSDGKVMEYLRTGGTATLSLKFNLGQNAVAAVGRTISHFARMPRGLGEAIDPYQPDQPDFGGLSESSSVLLVMRADGQFIPIRTDFVGGATVGAPLSSQDPSLRYTGPIGVPGNTLLDVDFSCQWNFDNLSAGVSATGFVASYLGCSPGTRASTPDRAAAGRMVVAVATNGESTVHAYTAGDYVAENTTDLWQVYRDVDAADACNLGGTVRPGSFDARVVSGVAYVGCIAHGNGGAAGMKATTYTFPSSLSNMKKIGWPGRARSIVTQDLGPYWRTQYDPMAEPAVGENWTPKKPTQYLYDRWSNPVMQLQFPCAELLGRPSRIGTTLDDCDPSTGTPIGTADPSGRIAVAPPPNWVSFTVANYASKGPGNWELAVNTFPIDPVPGDRSIASGDTPPPFGSNGYDRDNFEAGVVASPYLAKDLTKVNAGDDIDVSTLNKHQAASDTFTSPLFLAQVNRGARTPVEITLTSGTPRIETSAAEPIAVLQAPPSVEGLSQQSDFTPEFALHSNGTTSTSSGTSTSLGGHVDAEVSLTLGVGFLGNNARTGASVGTSVGWNNESESSLTKSVELDQSEGYGGAFDDTAVVTRAFKEYVWDGSITADPTGIATGAELDYRLPGELITSSKTLSDLAEASPNLYGPNGIFSKSLSRITNGYTIGHPGTYYPGASQAAPTSILESNGGPCIGGYTGSGIKTNLGGDITPPVAPNNPYLEKTAVAPTGPNVVASDIHHVDLGNELTESSSIGINASTSKSQLSSKSMDWDVTILGKTENEYSGGASAKLELALGAGINGAYTSSTGIEDSLATGSELSTTIGNIPFKAADVGSWVNQEQYDWRMYFCKARLGPQGIGTTVWVQGYVTGDYFGNGGVTDLGPAAAVSPVGSVFTSGSETGVMTDGAATACPAGSDPTLTPFKWSHPAGTMKRYALDLHDVTTGEDATYEVASWTTPDDFNEHIRRGPDDNRPGLAERVTCAAIPNTQFPAGHVMTWQLVGEGFTENEIRSPAAFFRPVGPQGPPSPSPSPSPLPSPLPLPSPSPLPSPLPLPSPSPLPSAATTVTVVDAPAVSEGGSAVFELKLDHATPTAISITVQTVNESARAGKDYAATTTVVRFPAGTRTASVSIKTKRDKLKERTETFLLKVTKVPAGVKVVGGTATGTIKNRKR